MTLTSHAIVGAGLASLMPAHPALGFVVGFGSHFLLDSIPHWDYQLASVKKDPSNRMNTDMSMNAKTLFDLAKVGLDAVLGITIGYLIFGLNSPDSFLAILCGAIGAQMPDVLQFAYWKCKHWPLTALQQFHVNIMHAKSDFNNRPFIGVPLQIAFLVACVIALKIAIIYV